jgi:ABC-type transporter Mla subunit MlaD
MPQEVDRHVFRANQAIDQVDAALAALRAALRDVDEAIRSAKERGEWNS